MTKKEKHVAALAKAILRGEWRPRPLFIIQDWTGARKFPDKTFDTFEDGWAFILSQFPNDDDAGAGICSTRGPGKPPGWTGKCT